jgi:predicted DCC family thiol-disulfide oxidoreductase YuxK
MKRRCRTAASEMAERSEHSGVGTPTDSDRSPADIVNGIDRPVLLFDGVCNLCNATIRAIVRLDDAGEILFAPLQSDVGAELLSRTALAADYFESVVLVEDGETYTKSDAIIRVCEKLDGPLPLVGPLRRLPKSLRDGAYDMMAEHRYRIFGRKDECPVPPEHIRERFIERSLA